MRGLARRFTQQTRLLHMGLLRRYGYRIGRHTRGFPNIRFAHKEQRLSIGDYCFFGNGSEIILRGNHRPNFVSTYPFSGMAGFWPESHYPQDHNTTGGDVKIGNGVRVGSHALILPGVTVGDGAIIDPHSVVTRDIPPYARVAGNPARITVMRFDAQTIHALMSNPWWALPQQKVRNFLKLLGRNDSTAMLTEMKVLCNS